VKKALATDAVVVHRTSKSLVYGTAAEGFSLGELASLFRRTGRLHAMRCSQTLDKEAVGWIGSQAVEARVRIQRVRQVVLARCGSARKMDLMQVETLRRLASGAEEVFLYAEKLGLVCEAGDHRRDHAVLRNEVDRARMFEEMKQLMVKRGSRLLLEVTVCEQLVL